jgi:hypothetical protein
MKGIIGVGWCVAGWIAFHYNLGLLTGLALAALWAFIVFVAPGVRVTARQHAVVFTLALIISVVAALYGVMGWIWVPIILGLGTLINWSMQMKALNNRIKRGDSPESILADAINSVQGRDQK